MATQEVMHHDTAPSVGERCTRPVRQTYDAATQVVADRPGLSLLVVAGVGFGLGLLLGHALGEPPRDERTAVARFGRNMLDAMGRCMPESVSSRWTS